MDRRRLADMGAELEGRGKMDSSTEACPLAYCEIEQLLISCAHTDRPFVLELPEVRKISGPLPVLQVLSRSNEPDVIRILARGSCGHGHSSWSPLAKKAQQDKRPNHEGYCPVTVVRGPRVEVVQPGEVYVQVYPPSQAPARQHLREFFQHHFMLSISPATYNIAAAMCSGGGGALARIETFPECTWRLRLQAAYRQVAGVYSLDLQGAVDFQQDQSRWCIGNACEAPTASDADTVFSGLLKLLSGILGLLTQLHQGQAQLKINWPRLVLEGDMKLVENKHRFTVDRAGQMSVVFDPLLGAELRVDLVPFLLTRRIMPFFSFINRILQHLERNATSRFTEFKAVISLFLIADGAVSGKLQWRWRPGLDPQPAGEIKSSLGFGVQALAGIQGRIFIVRAAAMKTLQTRSANGSGYVSAISGSLRAGTDCHEAVINGRLEFSGLEIAYASYTRIGLDLLATETVKLSVVAMLLERFSILKALLSSETVEEKKLWRIMEPWQWPPACEEGGNAVSVQDFISR